MTKTEKVTCDCCERDITYRTNCVDYRILLASESKNTAPGCNAVTLMNIEPAFKSTLHFCYIPCLKKYINEKWKD